MVWDLETVPDLAAADRILDMPKATSSPTRSTAPLRQSAGYHCRCGPGPWVCPDNAAPIFCHWASVSKNRSIQSLNHNRPSDGILRSQQALDDQDCRERTTPGDFESLIFRNENSAFAAPPPARADRRPNRRPAIRPSAGRSRSAADERCGNVHGIGACNALCAAASSAARPCRIVTCAPGSACIVCRRRPARWPGGQSR